MLNGVTQIIITKIDVLNEFDSIKICSAYNTSEGIIDYLPYSIEEKIEPIYIEMKGWKCDITKIRNKKDLPRELLNYVAFIEKEVNVPVKIISVGAEREATIFC